FFQAEDGIRDRTVTGVQTCALPIFQAPLLAIAAGLERVIAQAGEDRRPSLKRNGVILTGGGALLPGIAEFLTGHAGIPARVARDPQSCVAVGTGMALDNLQVIRRGQHYIT